MDTVGPEALFQASRECKHRLIRLLIDGGIQVNVRNTEQETPLILVCGSKTEGEEKEKVVQFLITKRAKANLQDSHGRTALIYACLTNASESTIRILLEAKANPWLEDESKNTAFDYAINAGNLSTVKLLITNCRENKILTKPGSFNIEMKRLEERLEQLPEMRKCSWPLMGPRNIESGIDKEEAASTAASNLLTVTEEPENVMPPKERRRKRSICHFDPIDMEAIRKSGESETDDVEMKQQIPIRKGSLFTSSRSASEDEKISLHFSDSDSSSLDRSSNASGLEKLLRLRDSFSSSMDSTESLPVPQGQPFAIKVEAAWTGNCKLSGQEQLHMESEDKKVEEHEQKLENSSELKTNENILKETSSGSRLVEKKSCDEDNTSKRETEKDSLLEKFDKTNIQPQRSGCAEAVKKVERERLVRKHTSCQKSFLNTTTGLLNVWMTETNDIEEHVNSLQISHHSPKGSPSVSPKPRRKTFSTLLGTTERAGPPNSPSDRNKSALRRYTVSTMEPARLGIDDQGVNFVAMQLPSPPPREPLISVDIPNRKSITCKPTNIVAPWTREVSPGHERGTTDSYDRRFPSPEANRKECRSPDVERQWMNRKACVLPQETENRRKMDSNQNVGISSPDLWHTQWLEDRRSNVSPDVQRNRKVDSPRGASSPDSLEYKPNLFKPINLLLISRPAEEETQTRRKSDRDGRSPMMEKQTVRRTLSDNISIERRQVESNQDNKGLRGRSSSHCNREEMMQRQLYEREDKTLDSRLPDVQHFGAPLSPSSPLERRSLSPNTLVTKCDIVTMATGSTGRDSPRGRASRVKLSPDLPDLVLHSPRSLTLSPNQLSQLSLSPRQEVHFGGDDSEPTQVGFPRSSSPGGQISGHVRMRSCSTGQLGSLTVASGYSQAHPLGSSHLGCTSLGAGYSSMHSVIHAGRASNDPLPEIVSAATGSPKVKHVAFLPPLNISSRTASAVEGEDGYFSSTPSPYDVESPKRGTDQPRYSFQPISPRLVGRSGKVFSIQGEERS